MSAADFEALARQRLSDAHYDFFAGGAGEESTLRANVAAYSDIELLPRVLRAVGEPDPSASLLGMRSRLPILLSPTAFHRLAHADGELATARAAASTGVVMIVSMAATTAVERIARVGATLWFQIYIQSDLAFTEHLVKRAESAGCRALVVTADSPAFGIRDRDRRNGFHDLPDGLRCENMVDDSGTARPIEMFSGMSWEHLALLRQMTSLPLVLKGVLHPADAALAVEHRVDAIMVSNHGGRQLDTVPPTIAMLPEIAAAVRGRVPLIVDGGVRRGTDVVKALALGADAVGIGRPAVWGLAAGGSDGVRAVLDELRDELTTAMALLGARNLSELDTKLVRSNPRVPPSVRAK
jgi:4-hydroxymandelate oxidase